MRSGTSFFNGTLYRKTLTRFWPLWAVNLVIWLFALPLNGLIVLADYLDGGRTGNPMLRFARNVGDQACEWGVVFALLAGLIVAMAVCSHLYNNRSANFMGVLPVRREGQFLSTYLAGLTMLIVPNVAVFLLTLLVEAAGGVVLWGPMLFWLAAMCGMEFFFYSFAVCLGQFAGHILALPVFYAVFNAIVIAVYGLLNWVMDVYYFGFASVDAGYGIVRWFTPVWNFFETLDCSVSSVEIVGDRALTVGDLRVSMEGLNVVGIYAIAAVVLTVCGLLLYRRRHMETAGDIVAVKAMRPVFKYGVAFCAGLFLGFLTQQMFILGELGMMAAVILWGIAGYFVAQMLLDKSFRVFKKWKGAAAVTVVFLVLFAAIGFDLTGYESRVPAANEVERVTISGLHGGGHWDSGSSLAGVELTDQEDIEMVTALHEAIVKYGEDGEPMEYGNYTNYTSFGVEYELKSGKTMRRSYYVPMGSELLTLSQTIRDDYDVRYQAYRLDEVAQFRAEGGWIEWANIYNYNYGSAAGDAEWTGSQAQALWDAVMADFEAGRIGVTDMTAPEEDYDVVYLEFQWGAKATQTGEPNSTMVEITGSGELGGMNMKYLYLEFAVPEIATGTWNVLDELLHWDNRYQDDTTDDPLWRSE